MDEWLFVFKLAIEKYGMSPDTVAILANMGHKLKAGTPWGSSYQGDGETVGVDLNSGLLLGASDPRAPDSCAVGF